MTISERVAYLKGLVEGLDINDTTKEGKVLLQMASILEEIALSIEDLDDELDEIVELVDVLDEDLGEVEEAVFEDDDCDCDCCDEDDEDFLYEVVCPTCGDTVCLTEDMLDEGSIDCPNCGELLEFDFDEEDDDDEDDED